MHHPTRWIPGAAALVALVLVAFTVSPEPLPIGSSAPKADVEMKGVDGEMHSLATAAGENGLLVIFSCNTCPWVKAWEDRYLTIAEQAEEQGIGVIALNPNAAYRDNGDSMADMKQQAEEMGYPFPYVLDANSEMADAFGATKTPDIFLFDSEMTLVYRGAIDDNARNPEAVENEYLSTAMTALVNGQSIDTQTTKSVGCTIKRTD